MTTPVAAQYVPFEVIVEEGKTYMWCACGLSRTQPFCDRSHRGGDIRPIPYTAHKTQKVYFCGCKQSINRPICDGTHGKLPREAADVKV